MSMSTQEHRSQSASGRQHLFNIPVITLPREVLLVTVVCSAQLMVQAIFAQGILPDTIIGQTFKVEMVDSAWGPAAYGMTSGTFVLPAGRIGDMYGHRRCFVGAWVWLALSSILTGLSVYSRSFIFYSVSRGLQGVAAATLVPCALAILGSMYKEGRRKNLIFSLYAFGSPLGYVLGSVFSALLTQLAWWPWMHWITGIVSVFGALGAWIVIPNSLGRQEVTKTPSKNAHVEQGFDWFGTMTGVPGLVLFCFAWNRAPAVGWQAAEVLAPLIIGVLLLCGFFYVERRTLQPLIAIRELSNETLNVLAVTGLAWASFGVMIYYAVNFTIVLRKASLLATAAQQLIVIPAGFSASYLNTWLLGFGVSPAGNLCLSTIFFTVSCVLLATLPIVQSYWMQLFWFYVLAPFGMDLSFPCATLLISRLVQAERQGVAASLVATVVYYSQSIGIGIAGTVEAYSAHDQIFRGYRNAFYTAVGLSGSSFMLAALFFARQQWKTRK